METNGYTVIYNADPSSYENGCQYEHRIVAEKILGRKLNGNEVVHHKDKDRKNNDPSNLIIFKSHSDHARYHCGGELIKNDDGTYSCLPKEKFYICPICGGKKDSRSKVCLECRKKEIGYRKPTREILESLIYTYPFTKIGEMFNVTDNAVRKWCKSYGLPYRKKDME